MKIAHVINGLTTGGAETFVVELASRQRDAGHEVVIVRLFPHDGEPYSVALRRGIVVKDIGGRSKTDLVRMWWRVSRIGHDVDVLHAHLYPAQLVVSFATGSARRFATEHSTFYRRRNVALIVLLDRLMYSRFEAIVCISDAVRAAVGRVAPRVRGRLKVIHNGIDVESLQEATPAPRHALVTQTNPKTRILLNIARMVAAKDQDTIIRAVALMEPHVHLVLGGDGERREQLEQLVGALGCRERVHFLGEVSDVGPLLKAADAFVLSSHWEGFGLSALEALAAGVPVLATANEGITSWAADHVRLTPLQDPAAMARNLRSMLELSASERAAIVANGMAFAEDFSIAKTTERYLHLYGYVPERI